MRENVIEVKNLVKKYGNFTAVNDISFNIAKGEVFAFLGPNGAGKTTTVEILECLK
jgi:ABC-2 type transport system ATP-binding protein